MKPTVQPKPERRPWTPLTQPPRPPEPAGWSALLLLLLVLASFAIIAAASAFWSISLNPAVWYLARATGITLYLLIWGTVVLGLGVTTRYLDGWLSRNTVYSLHTYIPRLAYAFLAAHLLSLIVDEYMPFSLLSLIIPFRSEAVEPWTGLGVIGMYLFLIISATIVLRRYIQYRIWRFLHWLSFPLYLLALLHGIGAGADSGSNWAQAIYATTGLMVLFLILVRFLQPGRGAVGAHVQASAPAFDRMGKVRHLPPGAQRRDI